MDAMFSLPWYVIRRRGAKLTQGMGSNTGAYDKGDLEKTPISGVLEERVENVESAGQKHRNVSGAQQTNLQRLNAGPGACPLLSETPRFL
jgi:hypothetical protein